MQLKLRLHELEGWYSAVNALMAKHEALELEQAQIFSIDDDSNVGINLAPTSPEINVDESWIPRDYASPRSSTVNISSSFESPDGGAVATFSKLSAVHVRIPSPELKPAHTYTKNGLSVITRLDTEKKQDSNRKSMSPLVRSRSDSGQIHTTSTISHNLMEEKYLKEYTSPSAQFLRIKFALQVLSSSLSFTIADDSLFRDCVSAVTSQNKYLFQDTSRSASKASKKVNAMKSDIESLEQEISGLKQSYENTQSMLAFSQKENSELRQRLSDSIMQEELQAGKTEVLLCENIILKAQLEMSSQKLDERLLKYNDMTLQQQLLSQKIEELTIENEIIKCKLENVKQLLSVTKVERDELVRQFLYKGRYIRDDHGMDILVTGVDSNCTSDSDENISVSCSENSLIGTSGLDGIALVKQTPRRESTLISEQQELFPKNSQIRCTPNTVSSSQGDFISWN